MSMQLLTSWDDGSVHDLKVAFLLNKYDLPGIFFIPTQCELSQNEIQQLSYHFDIGGDTTTHPHDLKKLSKNELYDEIGNNKDYLESITRYKLDWFAYPRGRHDEKVREVVQDCGYMYARTTVVNHTEVCPDNYQQHTTIHIHPRRKEYNGAQWLQYAKQKFHEAKEVNGVYHIWGHSWEIEQYDLWNELKELFDYIKHYGY